MRLMIAPGNVEVECKSVEMHNEKLDEAGPGDSIGFNVRCSSQAEIVRGCVVSSAEDDPARVVSQFVAQVIIVNHPSEIVCGYAPVVDCHTAHVACEFVELISKIDRGSGQVLDEAPRFLVAGDAAIVRLQPKRPLCVEPFAACQPLGRFIVRDMGQTVAVGVVREVVCENEAPGRNKRRKKKKKAKGRKEDNR